MRRFNIECGVSHPSAPDAIVLDVQGAAKNVNLRIDYIARRMLGNVPDLLIDLLEVAAYVYCADQRIGRGMDTLPNYGESWRRSLHFKIAVRHPDVWQTNEIRELLTDTLGFLSDDSYSFDFQQAEDPAQPRELYFADLIDASMEHDQVALFSGGVDSFAGAVDDIVTGGKSVMLVGHCSASKVNHVQKSLVGGLKKRGFGQAIFYIPVWVTNQDARATEFTQRTRSFLFACLGLIIARMSGKDSFTFYENGVVSINPPLAGDVIGGRATRTTHPKVIRDLEMLFSALLERTIEIRTPLQWLTKTEVTLKLRGAGFAAMLGTTSSCTRPRIWKQKQRHCGVCSQCIDRRFAVLAAGMEAYDPADNYMCDLLLGDRGTGNDLRMALSYVTLFKRMAATPRERFLVDFTEVVSAIGNFPGLSADEAGARLYDLFQRHAKAVENVVAEGLAKHSRALFRNELPSGSLLAICYSRGHIETPVPSDYDQQIKAFVDRLNAPVLEFAIDAKGKQILFRGGLSLVGKNFELVHALLADFRAAKADDEEVPFMRAPILAERMKITELSMRRQVSRLRDELDPLAVSLGIPLDQNTFIETKERDGYRLNPALREVPLADIKTDSPPPRSS